MMKLNRTNRFHMQFHLTEMADGKTQVIYKKPVTAYDTRDVVMLFNATISQMNQGWFEWNVKGNFVQDAFPFLSPDEREFLMTGTTPTEWKEMMREEED